jgi:hypothetical protein
LIVPPFLCPSAYLLSLTVKHVRYSKSSGQGSIEIFNLPKSLTYLELEVPNPVPLFSLPQKGDKSILQQKTDEAFPVLSYLSITTSVRCEDGRECSYDDVRLVLPSSLSHFRCTSQLDYYPAPWPPKLTYLDIPYARVHTIWIPGLPVTLKGLCLTFPIRFFAQLSAHLPHLQLFHQRMDAMCYHFDRTAAEQHLPPGLTSLRLPLGQVFQAFYSSSEVPNMSAFPTQLTTLDLGEITLSNASDVLLIPRTVTDMSFFIQGLSSLKAVPEGLRVLKYRQESHKMEMGIGPLLPRGLTRLDLGRVPLAPQEHHLLPSTLLELKISTINNSIGKLLAHLKALDTLVCYGGKLSKRGFLRIPRSVRRLELHHCFLNGSDALKDTLPNLTSFTYMADENYSLVLEQGVFSALPISLQNLRLWLGHSYSRFPWTSELSRLVHLKSFEAIGAPYDANSKRLVALPPSLTQLTCRLSWSFSLSDILQLPQSMRSVRIKSTSKDSVPFDRRRYFEKRIHLSLDHISLKLRHPYYEAYNQKAEKGDKP